MWAAFARSGIPYEWHGAVTSVDARHEKHPGIDDVWYVAVGDGEAVHLDAALAEGLRVGDRVDKERWSRTVEVNGAARRLPLSGAATALLAIAPITAGAVAATAYARSS